MALSFDPLTRRYKTLIGRVRSLTSAALSKLRDALTSRDSSAATLAADVSAGRISVGTWEERVWTSVKRRHVAQYILGRGGRSQMTDEDARRLETHLLAQQRYLRQFANDVRDGTMSAAKIEARHRMYESASVSAFESGQAGAWGIDLPAYPGGTSTRCGANCRCSLRYERADKEVRVYWRLGKAEHCPDCERYSQQWNPLVLPTVT